ncbi:hypothetical protein EDB81DRAFT_925251 [Dactylonectria macrodidyma]|uniref:NACHT domain-containing protein n=1 Tax=Dactylonectria macrodidyma TaxID=307937 RepID=A0A9P9JHG8_9HYPO|nr:hypothetical protein EDB81DRAFT_925251 [Dactylonectria macrodidyma]
MALALATASQLKPDIRLAQAVSEFEAALAAEQKAAFRTARSAARNAPLTIKDVMRLTAEVDLEASRKHGRVRCFGPRMTNMLQAIQQFAALGDVVIGGSQNLIACGVWAAVHMTVHFATGYLSHLEKLSLLFMAVGRHAPRYQAMAVVYPRSQNLQRYLFEYFIVVVNLCRRALEITQQSRFSRLTMSMSDPDLGEFGAQLETWSSSIKEEINLLLSQRVEDEARESAKFRALMNLVSESSAHRKKTKSRARFLDACSTYNYQQTWKQTRKIGSARLLLKSLSGYQLWKKTMNYPAALLLGGKLGAGKSVALANMVDDLNLEANRVIAYFFCRYDIPESLEARTIMGCLARQLLEQSATHHSHDHIFLEESAPVMDVDKILEVLLSVLPSDREFYLILDGLDECNLDEQNNMFRCFDQIQSKALANHKICVSVRSTPENLLRFGKRIRWYTSMPEHNEDIKEYIATEVDHCLQDGRLVVGDPHLAQDIKEALNDGANGMFLWVSLQLDLICSETSDHSIRESIKSMPRDLTEVYKRVLSKASSEDSKAFNVRVFKFLVAAIEPLTTEQLREAISVCPGDTIWKRSHQINSIQAVLRFCGSLIQVDEEEDTVCFIHHSAKSFCLRPADDSYAWLFTTNEAHKEMSETIVTYLSYEMFEPKLSTTVIPDIESGGIPTKVVQSTMQSQNRAANIAFGLFKLRPSSGRNIGPTLIEAIRSSNPTNIEQTHPFFPYARKSWTVHTQFFEHLDTYSHWCKLLDHSVFGIDFAAMSPRSPWLDYPRYKSIISGMPQRIKWALSHSHLLLLRHEMARCKGRDKLQIVGAIFSLLEDTYRRPKPVVKEEGAMFFLPPPPGYGPGPDPVPAMVKQMEHHILMWLAPFAITFGVKRLRNYLFETMSETDYTVDMLVAAVYSRDISAATTLLKHSVLDMSVLKGVKPPLFEIARVLNDTRMAYLLAKRGLAVNPYDNALRLVRIFSSALPAPVNLRFAQILLDAGMRLDNLSEEQIYFIITVLRNTSCGNRSILDSLVTRLLETCRLKICL